MAKFKVEFENGEVKRTLIFRGKEFKIRMGKWVNNNRSSDDKDFEKQLYRVFKLENITSETDALQGGDEYEIEEALVKLSKLE